MDNISLSARIGVPGFALDLEGNIKSNELLQGQTAPRPETLSYTRDLLRRLAERQRLLLMFDEAQSLAEDDANQALVKALRTWLDEMRIASIFSGSSMRGLRNMFTKKEAPFFHFAHPWPLPVLGEDYACTWWG